MIKLNVLEWAGLSNIAEYEDQIRRHFGPDYTFHKWVGDAQESPPVFRSSEGLEWVLVPGGTFVMGISQSEIEAALSLSRAPFLTFEEMLPTELVHVAPFLMLSEPLGALLIEKMGMTVSDTIGPKKIGLLDYKTAVSAASKLGGCMPTEIEWEYACRGGTQSLFWFGDKLPTAIELPHILGLELPTAINNFGLSSLFHGEWCSDVWRINSTSKPEKTKGVVIRGGASRFWPWQDGREWAGCVSAFRMPSQDMGGVGAALRLTRHLKSDQ